MKLSTVDIQNIITKLLQSEDYHVEILTHINIDLIQEMIEYLNGLGQIKLQFQNDDIDEFKQLLLNYQPTDELVLNLDYDLDKDMQYQLDTQITLDYEREFFDSHYLFTEQPLNIDLGMTFRFQNVSIHLTMAETLIVINTIAVKRAQLRGGAWSTIGKQVEKYLMLTLCALYQVPPTHYKLRGQTRQKREIDFYLIGDQPYACEVKLMGAGNPESADAVIARDSQVFIADTLSPLNKTQLDGLGIHWLALRDLQGYRKFYDILQTLHIPCTPFEGDLETILPQVFRQVFKVDPDVTI